MEFLLCLSFNSRKMTKIESSIKLIPYAQERVFNKLSDLNNLESVKNIIPADKIQDLSFDSDTLSVSVSQIGNISLTITEREPFKCIKFETISAPMPFNLWIQIAPVSDEECKLKLTVGLDINPIMKSMIGKPIREGLEKMGDTLALISF